MSASIELQRAATLLMEAACSISAAEWMTDAELRTDMLTEAERNTSDARHTIDKATPMLRRLNGLIGDACGGRSASE